MKPPLQLIILIRDFDFKICTSVFDTAFFYFAWRNGERNKWITNPFSLWRTKKPSPSPAIFLLPLANLRLKMSYRRDFNVHTIEDLPLSPSYHIILSPPVLLFLSKRIVDWCRYRHLNQSSPSGETIVGIIGTHQICSLFSGSFGFFFAGRMLLQIPRT